MNSVQFSENFLSEIERSNLEKEQAPLALVLRAEYNPEGSLSGLQSEQPIWAISRIFRVSIKIISDASSFDQKILEAQNENGIPISLLVVIAHGEPDALQFGSSSYLTDRDLYAEEFTPLHPDARVILLSCSTAPLAEKMAVISRRTILAPEEIIYSERILFDTHENDLHFLYYDNDPSNPIFSLFRPDASSIPLVSDPDLLKSALVKKENYFKKQAGKSMQSVDQVAVAELFFEDLREPSLQQSSARKAVLWSRLSASQGNPKALYILGVVSEYGKAGVKQSFTNAFKYYLASAEGGDPLAQCKVAYFYMGIYNSRPISMKKARYWFEQSESQGNLDAKEALRSFPLLGFDNENGASETLENRSKN